MAKRAAGASGFNVGARERQVEEDCYTALDPQRGGTPMAPKGEAKYMRRLHAAQAR